MSEAPAGQIPIRPLKAAPRTAERPMEFTTLEFLRGLVVTFLVFNVLLPVSLGLMDVVSQLSQGLPPTVGLATLIAVPLYAAPISGLACLTYGGLLALALGKLLRGEPRRWVHRLAYLVLGLLVGWVTAFVLQGGVYGSPSGTWLEALINPGHLAFAVPTMLAVWLGWEWTSARALRADAARAAGPGESPEADPAA